MKMNPDGTVILAFSLTGCADTQLPQLTSEEQVSPYTLEGRVDFGSQRKTQALSTEVSNATTVLLSDRGGRGHLRSVQQAFRHGQERPPACSEPDPQTTASACSRPWHQSAEKCR